MEACFGAGHAHAADLELTVESRKCPVAKCVGIIFAAPEHHFTSHFIRLLDFWLSWPFNVVSCYYCSPVFTIHHCIANSPILNPQLAFLAIQLSSLAINLF